MPGQEVPIQGAKSLTMRLRQEVFGPGLPEPEARIRLVAGVFTTGTVLVWAVVLLACAWAVMTLPWLECIPICLAMLAIGFFVAFRLGDRALRKQFPEEYESRYAAKTPGENEDKQVKS